jgi:hypothetical protein
LEATLFHENGDGAHDGSRFEELKESAVALTGTRSKAIPKYQAQEAQNGSFHLSPEIVT